MESVSPKGVESLMLGLLAIDTGITRGCAILFAREISLERV